jgi:hypothetical protein
MKRNMDLVREILLAVESHPHGFAPHDISIDGFSEEEVGYHCHLLGQGGLAKTCDITGRGDSSPSAAITSLTWEGHEFLEASREPTRWKQAKEVVDKLGGASIAIWTSVLSELVRKNIAGYV